MVDILMATYNGEKYLKEQLDSIAAQTYKNWRLIVRDDCSVDRTIGILKRFREHYPDQVVIIENDHPSGSAKHNFFKLVKDATAKYIMFCDQDDVWKTNKIEITLKVMKSLERRNEAKPLMVYTDLFVVDEQLNVLSESFRSYMNLPERIKLSYLLIQNCVTGCTVMINQVMQSYLSKVNDVEDILMHDHFIALIGAVFGQAEFIKNSTIYYRQHGSNSVGAADARSFGYLYQRFLKGRKDFRSQTAKTMRQVKVFVDLYRLELEHIPVQTQYLLKAYSGLDKKTKLGKIRFYLTHRVLKHGTIRRIMQFVWT